MSFQEIENLGQKNHRVKNIPHAQIELAHEPIFYLNVLKLRSNTNFEYVSCLMHSSFPLKNKHHSSKCKKKYPPQSSFLPNLTTLREPSLPTETMSKLLRVATGVQGLDLAWLPHFACSWFVIPRH